MDRREPSWWSTARGKAILALVVPAAVCGLVGAKPSSASSLEGTSTVRVVLDATGHGVFLAEGGVSDSGPVTAHRTLAKSRLYLTETLEGSAGTIVIRVVHACRRPTTSTWSVERGYGGYAGLTGAGRGTGGLPCSGPRMRLRAVYRGSLRPAPRRAPLAQAGPYGGWSSQDERLTLDVLPDGRHLTNVRLEQLRATCAMSLSAVVQPSFLATYAIAEDGSFSLASGGATIVGRFTGSQAQGTISYESSGSGSACSSGSVGWTASSPPPTLPSARPGSYCGSTGQQLGVCVRVTSDGKVGNLTLDVRLDCVSTEADPAQFDTVIGFGGRLSLRSNLTFDVDGSPEDPAGGVYTLHGSFGAGAATGIVSLRQVSYDQDGIPFTCSNADVRWSAHWLGP
jgi:hypothetical protein